jgi:diacylglycerol kinase
MEKCEWLVKVFNSSVENHVEKSASRLEIVRQAKDYFTLHYFCAVCSLRK